ncbi:MAG: hypothetical protein HY537_10295 [Deltaproteobacteria bacterium]|nr:hypothetical protein [Deltaproteobacteria bacterium]
MWLTLCYSFFCLSVVSHSEPLKGVHHNQSTQHFQTQVDSTQKPSFEKPLLTLEIRPSLVAQRGLFQSENLIELGYLLSEDSILSYRQTFAATLAGEKDFQDDGFLRVQIKNMAVHPNTGLALSGEFRVYTPTDAGRRDKGFITMVRSYFTMKQPISDTVAVSITETPIFHVYSAAGTQNLTAGTFESNPFYENRLQIALEFSAASKRLNFSFPIWLKSIKYNEYTLDTVKSDSWNNEIYAQPEISYKILPTAAIGLAFESASFTVDNLSGIDIGQGLEGGKAQCFFKLAL